VGIADSRRVGPHETAEAHARSKEHPQSRKSRRRLAEPFISWAGQPRHPVLMRELQKRTGGFHRVGRAAPQTSRALDMQCEVAGSELEPRFTTQAGATPPQPSSVFEGLRSRLT